MNRLLVPLVLSQSMLLASCSPAQSNSAQLDTQIIELWTQGAAPGVQVCVHYNKTKWSRATGYADIESQILMDSDTPVRAASLTKPFTYAAVMELQKQGLLTLEDTIDTHLSNDLTDGLPNTSIITILHLLDHQSGLYNFNGSDDAPFFKDLIEDKRFDHHVPTPSELLRYAHNQSMFEPGTQTAYCSTSYIVLGLIIEQVTNKPYHEAVRELILDPLEMRHTKLEGYEATHKPIAHAYSTTALRRSPLFASIDLVSIPNTNIVNLSSTSSVYNAWAWSAGAYTTTASDLAKFGQAVLDRRITAMSDTEERFARPDPQSRYDWNGGSFGITSSLWIAPKHGVVVAAITNADSESNNRQWIADLVQPLEETAIKIIQDTLSKP